METAAKACAQSDPWEFVSLFDEIDGDYPFHDAQFRAGDAVSAVRSLVDGLRELDAALDALREAGKLDYFLALVASLESLRDEVEKFLEHVDSPTFSLNWSLEGESDARVRVLYDAPAEPGEEAFVTNHDTNVTVSHRDNRKRRVTAAEVLEAAQLALRATVEKRFLPQL